MTIETIYNMQSAYRDDFKIKAYHFGDMNGEKSLAVVGPMRGDEIQQQLIAAHLVKTLTELEERGCIKKGVKITVIPSCNPFSMNVKKRFWTMDNTDINRMFPGYDKGETTQQIAGAIFKHLEGYKYGVQLASFYMPGEFVPHIRMLKTGYEDVDGASLFGFSYVSLRKPLPFDTTLLNYNWQIWDTKAYSLYAGQTEVMSFEQAEESVDAILRFMYHTSLSTYKPFRSGYISTLIDEQDLILVKTQRAGLYHKLRKAGEMVHKGDTIARIIDPYNGAVIEEIKAPCSGELFFVYRNPLVLQSAIVFKIIANKIG